MRRPTEKSAEALQSGELFRQEEVMCANSDKLAFYFYQRIFDGVVEYAGAQSDIHSDCCLSFDRKIISGIPEVPQQPLTSTVQLM